MADTAQEAGRACSAVSLSAAGHRAGVGPLAPALPSASPPRSGEGQSASSMAEPQAPAR